MTKITQIAALTGLLAVLAGPALAAKSDSQARGYASDTVQVQNQQNPDRNFYSSVPGSQHDFQLEGR